MVNCEECMNFAYDEEYEEYLCGMDMDEDEIYRLNTDSKYGCPTSDAGMNIQLYGNRFDRFLLLCSVGA